MKKYPLIIVLVMLLLSVAQWKALSPVDDLIVPGKKVGRVTASSSEKELIQLYGKLNVIRETIHVCDGYDEPGTIINPLDELHTLEITWRDKQNFRYPDCVIIRGSRSAYKTPEGITLGTTITLDRI